MKKKFFKILILFSFLFCISNVDANECVNITISSNSGVSVGNYKYKYWDKKLGLRLFKALYENLM